MGKARTLAGTVSAGGPLVDGGVCARSTPVNTNGAASYDIPNIPAWAKKVTLIFRNVSANGLGTGGLQVQLGTSGGFAASGYTGTMQTLNGTTLASSASLTTSFLITGTGSDAFLFSGTMELTEIEPNVWVHKTYFGASGSRGHLSVGEIALGGELTSLRVFMGVGTFDGGTINALFE